LNANAVASVTASRLQVSKGQLLDDDEDNLGVRMAISEANIIQETKKWLKAQGLDVNQLESVNRTGCSRNKKIVLVKNLAADSNAGDIKEMFSRYGKVKVSLSPSNTLGVVKYD
jgi:multiple RNA-binding domain-containing protein 1